MLSCETTTHDKPHFDEKLIFPDLDMFMHGNDDELKELKETSWHLGNWLSHTFFAT